MRPMKESGIAWIGKIPQEWEIRKLRDIGTYINGYAFKPEDWGTVGKRIIRIQDLTGSNDNSNFYAGELDLKYLVKKGDILVSWAATLEAFIWREEEGFLNQHIFKALPIKDVVSYDYFFWLLKVTMENMNNDNKHGIMMEHVTLKVFNPFRVPLPPLPEQQAIADKLDRVCGEIDNVIAKTKAVVEEYKKLKQAIITEAVTGEKQCGMRNSQCGIKEKRPMKDSGIPWIGKIPQEWEVTKVKRYVIWKSEKGFPNAEVLSLYRDYGIVPKNSRDDNHNVTSLDTGSYKYVNDGDLVVNKMKAWQGSIAVSHFVGIVSPAYHVFEFYNDNSIVKDYLHYLLRCKIYLPEYLRLSTGMRIGQWDLSESDFRNILIVVPPFPEQQAIVAYLDSKCGAIDEVIAKKQQLIREMENYKKSVIYEYVTGKKDVGVNEN